MKIERSGLYHEAGLAASQVSVSLFAPVLGFRYHESGLALSVFIGIVTWTPRLTCSGAADVLISVRNLKIKLDQSDVRMSDTKVSLPTN